MKEKLELEYELIRVESEKEKDFVDKYIIFRNLQEDVENMKAKERSHKKKSPKKSNFSLHYSSNDYCSPLLNTSYDLLKLEDEL